LKAFFIGFTEEGLKAAGDLQNLGSKFRFTLSNHSTKEGRKRGGDHET